LNAPQTANDYDAKPNKPSATAETPQRSSNGDSF
jgi:hypothetical protein